MNPRTSIASLRSVKFKAAGFPQLDAGGSNITATTSQEKLTGFEQTAIRNAWLLFIGAGGLASNIVNPVLRKGAGHIEIYDGDTVEIGNLGRQAFFPSDIGKNKAICLAERGREHASCPAEIIAHPSWFQDADRRGEVPNADAVFCCPDYDEARLYCARRFRGDCPVIFIGVDARAEHGYVFVQKKDEGPCFACLFPDAIGNTRRPCPGTPAMIDVLLTLAGLSLTALDSLLMKGRPIHWNYIDIYNNGLLKNVPLNIKQRDNCPVCSSTNNEGRTES